MITQNAIRKMCGAASGVGALFIASTALAVPIQISNDRPTTINPPPGVEGSVQSILDFVFGAGNVDAVNDQSSASKWQSAVFPASTIPTLVVEYAGNADTNVFGIWFGSDTTNILTIDLLFGPATANTFGATAGLQFIGNSMAVSGNVGFCGTAVNCGVFTDPLISASSFGFYLGVGDVKYFSADQLNPNGEARMVAYEGSPTNWLLAFEDGTDFDFNDMAIKIESIRRVPEPTTLALLGMGLFGLAALRRRQAAR